MPWVDAHSVGFHSILDLIDNRLSCSLDSKDLGNFDYMVGGGIFSNDSCEGLDVERFQARE